VGAHLFFWKVGAKKLVCETWTWTPNPKHFEAHCNTWPKRSRQQLA